jgi:hypothetical protein
MNMTARSRHRRPPDHAGGVSGNERLTALTGTVLLIGFAVEGLTIVSLGRLLTLHFFLGLLLIGPVLLKIGSTGYRFTRYYAGAPAYVAKGPPAPLLRVLGPLVIVTSLAVLGTGVMLAIVGPASGPWLFLHKATFVLWFGVMTIHVLTYVWQLPRILLSSRAAELGVRAGGGWIRGLLVAASLLGGLVIALLLVHLVHPWETGVR